MIDREPRTSPSEGRHHFIGNHQDAVFVAELANAFQISIRRNKNAVGSRHWFENKRRNRLRTFELNSLFNHGERRFGGIPSALDAVIRIEHVNHARNARLRSPSARIAREGDRSRGRAVVGAIACHNLVASGEEARELDGVLVSLSAAVGEEKGVNIAGSDFGELRAKTRTNLSSHERVRVGERRGLIADGLDDARVAVSDVDGHELAVEVDEALAFWRVEVNPLGAADCNGVDFRLRGPFEKRVLSG